MDPFGHVNNGVFFQFYDTAKTEYLSTVCPDVNWEHKAIVVVRKSGTVETFKKKHLTYDKLYKRQSFDLTNANPPLVYLTPAGVAVPGQGGTGK